MVLSAPPGPFATLICTTAGPSTAAAGTVNAVVKVVGMAEVVVLEIGVVRWLLQWWCWQ